MSEMPREIFIEANGTTIHGEMVIPEYSAHKYSNNPLNGKLYTKYTRADTTITKEVLEGMRIYDGNPQENYGYNAALDDVIKLMEGK